MSKLNKEIKITLEDLNVFELPMEIANDIVANNDVERFNELMEDYCDERMVLEYEDTPLFSSDYDEEYHYDDRVEAGLKWKDLRIDQQEELLYDDYNLYFIEGNNEYLEIVFDCGLKCKCKLIGEEIIIDDEEVLELA